MIGSAAERRPFYSLCLKQLWLCAILKRNQLFETELNEGTRTKNSHNLGNEESANLPCQGETQLWNVVVQRERTNNMLKSSSAGVMVYMAMHMWEGSHTCNGQEFSQSAKIKCRVGYL